ncbi:MAG: TspO/MBR family protein [Candidatus Paceibacterota bacterium]|jgi:tryptophan-rich sensory protein
MEKMQNKLSLLVFVGVVGAVEFIGSFLTIQAVMNWYPELIKPSFNPPNWLFAPVWSILYILIALLIALSGWLVWAKREENKGAVDAALTIYTIQLFLNVAWSYLFFWLNSPVMGLIGIIALWAAIVWNMASFYRISKKAFYLFVPYVIWVSFAAILNFAIWQLN